MIWVERRVSTVYTGADLETRTLLVAPSVQNDDTSVYLTGYAPGGQQFFAYLSRKGAENLIAALQGALEMKESDDA